MYSAAFADLVGSITGEIAGKALDASLQDFLNGAFGVDSGVFKSLYDECRTGVTEGWLCQHEQAGIKFGRVIKPGGDTHEFSVDVVDMVEVVGPHHRHPKGEIDLVMPQTDGAEFDGHGAGWVVYGPDSAHKPTVTGGRALVLYLLPGGEIEFSRS